VSEDYFGEFVDSLIMVYDDEVDGEGEGESGGGEIFEE